MTPKHTPEPWDHMPPIGEGFDAVLAKQVTSYGNFYVAQCNVAADAARIVACVNACAGLNPEAIPALVEAAENLCRPHGGPKERLALLSALAAVKGEK